MPETGIPTGDVKLAESIHEAARARFVITEAIEDSIEAARRIGKRGSDAAEELMDDTIQRIKRHPTETVVLAFAAGFFVGGCVSWMTQRK